MEKDLVRSGKMKHTIIEIDKDLKSLTSAWHMSFSAFNSLQPTEVTD